MLIQKRHEAKFSEVDGSCVTPRMFREFKREPLNFNNLGGIDIPHPAIDKISVGARVLLFYGDVGLQQRFVFAEPPINPKTNDYYGTDTKAYRQWAEGINVPPERVVGPRDIADMRALASAVQGQPWFSEQLATTGLLHSDVCLSAKVGDHALVGYCDWLFDWRSGKSDSDQERIYVPMNFYVVNNIDYPYEELAVRGKLTELAFVAYAANVEQPHSGQYRSFYVLLAETPKGKPPRVGVYTVDVSAEIHENIVAILKQYYEQKKAGKWISRFVKPLTLSMRHL